jgi:trehalose-6-phosphate synthase
LPLLPKVIIESRIAFFISSSFSVSSIWDKVAAAEEIFKSSGFELMSE